MPLSNRTIDIIECGYDGYGTWIRDIEVDEVGRIQTPPEKREALLAQYDRSGMTGAPFARFSGVRYATLTYWLQRRARKLAGASKWELRGRIIRVGWKRE